MLCVRWPKAAGRPAHEEVKSMKKITIRKSGSVRLTSTATAFYNLFCM